MELPAFAAAKNWTGGGGTGNWSTSGNWSPAGAPANGDDVTFPGGLGATITNNLTNLRLNSIAFSGAAGAYFIRGNPLTLTNGINAGNTAGANTVDFPITNGASQTFTATTGGTLTIASNLVFNGFNLTVNAAFNTSIGGLISGTGNLTKNGIGDLLLNGATSNLYSGTTTVNVGSLTLNDVAGPSVVMVPGDITVGNGASLILGEGNQIADTSDITINGTGTFNLAGFDETIGTLTFTGSGSVTTGTGVLTNGNITVNGSASASLISGNLHIGNSTRTFTVATANSSLVISAVISGGSSGSPLFLPAGIIKSGPGTMTFSAANTFGGQTTVNDGILNANNNLALGGTFTLFGSAATLVNSNASLILNNAHITNEVLTLASVNTSGALQDNSTADWVGSIILNTDVVIEASSLFVIDGNISGPGGFTKVGASTLTLRGTNSNTYGGTTTVKDGTLLLDKNVGDAIPGPMIIGDDIGTEDSAVVRLNQATQFATDDVTIRTEGLLDLNNFSETVANLAMTGGTALSGTNGTAANLTVTGAITIDSDYPADTTSRIGGRLNVSSGTRNIFFPIGSLLIGAPELELDAVVLGSAAIVVSGNSGDLFLNNANTFTGPFTVSSSSTPGILVHLGDDLALGAITAGTTNSGATSGFFIELAADNISEPITLCGNGPTFNDGVISLAGGCNWNTNIVLGCDATINCPSGTLLTFNGVVSGPGGLTKIGPGTLTLSGGTGGNAYAGNTIVNEGILQLDKATAVRFGTLTVGDGTGGINADIVRYTANDAIDFSVPIIINSSGLLDLDGFSDIVGALTLNSGDISTGTGILTMNANLTAVSSSAGSLAAITGILNLGSGTRTFTVTNGPVTPDLAISAEVRGTGGITKAETGLMSLTHSNSFSGAVTVNDGTLRLDDDFAAGTIAGGVVVNGDASLELVNGAHVGAEPLTLNTTAIGSGNGAMDVPSGTSNSWAGDIIISTTAHLTGVSSATLNLSGAISGPGGIIKDDTSTVYFSGGTANSYVGTTTINAGTLILNKGALNGAIVGPVVIGDGAGGANADVLRLATGTQIDNNSAVTINSSGLFDQADNGEAVGSIAGSGNIDLGTGFLNTGFNNTSTLFSGVISGFGGGNLNKVGTGTLTLTGVNTYDGATTVSTGTLLVNGVQVRSAVSVSGTGTLGGTGTVGNISCSANLTPGASPGMLTSSNLTFTAAGDYFVELTGPTPGTDYDQMNVRGTNNLANAVLHVTANFATPASIGDQFVIINNDGADAITGTFSGLPSGAAISSGAFNFTISYTGGSGNDVVLTLTNVPSSTARADVTSGNGNHVVDPNECNSLDLVISNRSGTLMTGVTATLSSPTLGVAITQPYSDYVNVPVSGNRTNTTPFQISTLSNLTCGADITLELTLNTASHGSFVVPFVLRTGSPATVPLRFDVSAITNIPDVGTIESTNFVGAFTGPLKKVAVSLWLTHPHDSDLNLSLISPDGVIIDLSSGNGAGADFGTNCSPDIGRTTFDDSAATAITAGASPFIGTFRPEASLSALNNGTAIGNWRLRVTDNVGGSLGALRCWSLFLYPVECAAGGGACDVCLAPITNAITVGDLSETNRISRNNIVPSCGSPKAFPGVITGSLHYDVYTFTNTTADDACVTVQLSAGCDLQSVAYLTSFDPLNISSNYLADSGFSTAGIGGTLAYSFSVPAGARFLVVVNEVNPSAGCNYTLSLSGLPCAPPALTINPTTPSPNVRVHWPTSAGGFKLEAATSLSANNWATVTNEPVESLGRFNVTNSSAQPTNRFYRLHKP